MKTRKKLIEVALPLEAINKASAHEKQPGIGAHPRGLHLWWARRPLAAARAVIFAQMVDDPSTYVDTLVRDPATQRAATRELKTRRDLWERRKAEYDEAQRTGDTTIKEPGPEPILEDCAADLERQRLFRLSTQSRARASVTRFSVSKKSAGKTWWSSMPSSFISLPVMTDCV
jgi:putative DNA methylase